MPPTVHNDDVGHRLLEIVLPFQGLVTAPIATQDYPFPAIDVCASDGNSFRVETAITGHLPHRSGRDQFGHPVPR